MMDRKSRLFAGTILLLALIILVPGCRKSGNSTATATKSSAKAQATMTTAKTAAVTAKTSSAVSTAAAAGNTETQQPGDSEEQQGTEEQQDSDSGTIDSGPFIGLKFNPEGMDLGGRTMQFGVRGLPKAKETSPAAAAFLKRVENTEKLFNVKIEFVPNPQLGASAYNMEFINRSMAGIKFADLIHNISSSSIPNYAINKFIIPSDDYIDFSHPFWKQTAPLVEFTDGKHYSMATHGVYGIVPNSTVYNTDILSREGIEDILELYKKGQWNWNTLLDISIKCTRDFNG
ncbi:MAG TPA: hypothetical protein DD727_03540, partial [Clostridiales bacterium]|nr:hypothetical protein [Clostridiales bacterium]